MNIHRLLKNTGCGFLDWLKNKIPIRNIENLNLFDNLLTGFPNTIVNLGKIAMDGLDISFNQLDTAHLSWPWESWADARDSDWRTTQKPTQSYIKKLNQEIDIRQNKEAVYIKE